VTKKNRGDYLSHIQAPLFGSQALRAITRAAFRLETINPAA
jgi:hypothetical protein